LLYAWAGLDHNPDEKGENTEKRWPCEDGKENYAATCQEMARGERERERERRERERERTFSALTVLNTGKEAVQRGCCAGGNIYNESSRKKYDFDIQRWRCNKLVTSFQSLPGILQIERWCGYQGSRQQAPSGGNMKNAP
jgi:hypothetical protein